MSPENHWLEDVFPIEIAPFFRGCTPKKTILSLASLHMGCLKSQKIHPAIPQRCQRQGSLGGMESRVSMGFQKISAS